jgi:hypothetical protein
LAMEGAKKINFKDFCPIITKGNFIDKVIYPQK